MSTSKRACGPAARNRGKSSRSVLPHYFLGSVAVAGLVLGCAWTVYTNVFGAGIYPSVSSAAFEAPPVTSSTVVAARPARPNFNEIFASLPDRSPLISAPENVSASLMFNERFAAASPQGEPPRPVEASRLADASPPVDAPKAAGTPRLVEGPKSKPRSARAERTGAEAGGCQICRSQVGRCQARGEAAGHFHRRHGPARQGRRDVDRFQRQADHG